MYGLFTIKYSIYNIIKTYIHIYISKYQKLKVLENKSNKRSIKILWKYYKCTEIY